ncbi:MAG: hypothetical protein GX922_03890 [Firmicutes bacterium]|jgi:hypothetical protein|nr:hypothetical protein [Bacillota bacterium]
MPQNLEHPTTPSNCQEEHKSSCPARVEENKNSFEEKSTQAVTAEKSTATEKKADGLEVLFNIYQKRK